LPTTNVELIDDLRVFSKVKSQNNTNIFYM